MAVFCQEMSVVNLPNIDPLFLKQCASIAVAGAAAKPDIQSLTATGFGKPSIDPGRRARIVADYPDAFTDTYGTISGSPFLYKTGSRWPTPGGGPEAQPFIRQLYPVYNHPITDSWPGILENVKAYLSERQMPFTAVTGFGWGNQRAKEPFCPLLMTISMEPDSVTFDNAKTAADHIKGTILDNAGFPEIEVAVWEWKTSFSGIGPKLTSLNPLVDGVVTEFASPFASTLPVAIAPLKKPHYEGTASLFLRRGGGSDRVLALTAAHVVRPPRGLTEKASSRHREEIIVLGEKGFEDAITKIESRIGMLQEIITSAEESIERLQQQEADGTGEPQRIASALRREREKVTNSTEDIEQLDRLHTRVAKTMLTTNKRVIGHVLHADPVGVSSGPDGFTIDWAVVELSDDAFDWANFKGNKVYIGGKIDKESFRELMYPWAADRAGYAYPQDGLLPIFDVVSESEMRQPRQRNGRGGLAIPVIKNGLITGTTVGWLNGLKSLVRHYDFYDITFTSFETTIVPYGGRGAFSEDGDSGSIILDRKGRIVALLTGGSGLTDETDVTFATAWYALKPHIKNTLEGICLY